MTKYMYRIKLVLLLVLCSTAMEAQKDQVLFHIDKEPVRVSEFKYIYEKNNRDQADYSRQSLDEYLDLYINFKLKVHKAKALNYDQSEAYQEELAGYRRQLADSYVIDREVISRMVDEIHDRQKYDLELRHILISANRKTADATVEQAQNKIVSIKKEIDQGMSFDQAIVKYSQDRSSAIAGGNIGFVNAPLPDGYVALEDAAYNLEVNGISDPIRTDRGYHIIQLVSRRPARGVMEAQHLLIRGERNGIKLADAYPRIKKIHDKIVSGETTFDNATIVSSEDKETKGNGGNLGFFGIGQYERSFEDGAFALNQDGDISEPIETSIGWHIIRRVSARPLNDKETIEEKLKSQPKQGERFERVRQDVVAQIKKEASFKEDRALLGTLTSQLTEGFYDYTWQVPATLNGGQLISYGEDEYQLSEFAEYAKKNNKLRMRAKGQKSLTQTVEEIYQSFVVEKAISYAEDRLEDRYIEFRNLMREYREGILLFDVTKDYVWDKASSDNDAIEAFYAEHKEDYQWEERAKITNYSIRSVAPQEVTKILNASRKRSPKELIEEFNKEKELLLYNEETLEQTNPTLQGLNLIAGNVSSPKFNKGLKMTTFTKIEEVIPARPKTLKEAKGYVISAYQDQLDKDWIEDLRKEYKVKVNNKTLKKLIK